MVVLHPGMRHTYSECDDAFELVNIAYRFKTLVLPRLDGANLALFKILFPEGKAVYNALEPVMTLNNTEPENAVFAIPTIFASRFAKCAASRRRNSAERSTPARKGE